MECKTSLGSVITQGWTHPRWLCYSWISLNAKRMKPIWLWLLLNFRLGYFLIELQTIIKVLLYSGLVGRVLGGKKDFQVTHVEYGVRGCFLYDPEHKFQVFRFPLWIGS